MAEREAARAAVSSSMKGILPLDIASPRNVTRAGMRFGSQRICRLRAERVTGEWRTASEDKTRSDLVTFRSDRDAIKELLDDSIQRSRKRSPIIAEGS